MSEEKFTLTMENSLISNLKPVQPDPDFINNLRSKLLKKQSIYIEKTNHVLAFILMSIGLFMGALILWFNRKD